MWFCSPRTLSPKTVRSTFPPTRDTHPSHFLSLLDNHFYLLSFYFCYSLFFFSFRNIIIVFLLTFVSHSRNVRFSPSFCFRLVFKFHNFSATSFNNFFQQVSCTCIQRTRVLCRRALSSRTYTFHTHTSIPKYVTSTYLHYTACDFLSLHFALLVV